MSMFWVDNLSGIWMLLIVLWHCFFPEGFLLVKYIFSFHVVLFFILSGFLFNEKKYVNFNKFMKNKFFSLIIPFLFFNMMFFIFFKLMWEYKSTSMIDFMVWVLYWDYLWNNWGYINNTWGFNMSNTSTWFLPTLFITSMYYFFINLLMKNKFIKVLFVFILSIVIYMESKLTLFSFPWWLEMSFMMLFFYTLANTYKKNMLMLVEKMNIKFLLIIPLMLLFHLFLLNSTNVSTNYYWNYYFFMMNSFLGFFTVLIFSKMIWENNMLSFLWKNSMIMLWFEWIKEYFMLNMNSMSFGLLNYEKTYILAFIQFFLTMMLLIPIMIIINKFLPFILWMSYKK